MPRNRGPLANQVLPDHSYYYLLRIYTIYIYYVYILYIYIYITCLYILPVDIHIIIKDLKARLEKKSLQSEGMFMLELI